MSNLIRLASSIPKPIKIINSELTKNACCGYGEWHALDLLVKLWMSEGNPPQLTETCPSCGATVQVDWNTESAVFIERKT